MKNYLLVLCLFLCVSAISQETSEKTKKLSDEACTCIDKINLNADKEQKAEEISNCISSAIMAHQLENQLSELVEITKDTLGKIDDLTKIDTLKIGNDVDIIINDQDGYEEIEAYLYDHCEIMKKIYFVDNKAYENSYSDRKKALKYYDEGQVAFSREKYELAITLFNKAVKEDKNFAFAWDNLGYSYRKLNNYNKAIECYKKSIVLDPKGKMPLMNIAVAYELNNDIKGAKDSYKNYISIYEDDPEGFYGLGRIYFIEKNYELALENLIPAYILYTEMKSPYNIDAQKHLGWIYADLKQQNNLELFNKIAKKHNLQINKED